MAKAPSKKTGTTEASSPTSKLKAAATKVAKTVAAATAPTSAAVATTPAAKSTTRGRAAKPAIMGSTEVVMTVTHDQIARKAYEIWMAKGCPNGREQENWREAEMALKSGR